MQSTRLRHYYSYFPDLQRVHSISDSLSVAPALYFNRCVRFISCRGLNDSSTALVFPSGTYLLDGCTVAGEARGYGTDEYSNDDSFHETTTTSLHRHRRLMKLRNSNACTATLRCLKRRRRHRETFVGTMEAGNHRDSYPLFTLNAIYQHLDPAQLKFSRRSLHRVFRWSMTLWRAEPWQTRRVCIPQKCLEVDLEFALRNSVTWPHFPSRHLHSTVYSQFNQLKGPAYTLASSLCHQSSEIFCGERSAQAQRLDAHVPSPMISLFDSNECNRTGIRLS